MNYPLSSVFSGRGSTVWNLGRLHLDFEQVFCFLVFFESNPKILHNKQKPRVHFKNTKTPKNQDLLSYSIRHEFYSENGLAR